MAMSQPSRGLVLGEIPRVHEGVVTAIRRPAHIDLAGAAGAVAVGCSCRGQAGAVYISFKRRRVVP
jgi:hypothetical protein